MSYSLYIVPRSIWRSFMRFPNFPTTYARQWPTFSFFEPIQIQRLDPALKYDRNQFKASLDVQEFKPSEISVKLGEDNQIVIEGKREEHKDDSHFISSQFVKKFVLPDDCDVEKLESQLSSDGILTIMAPRNPPPEPEMKNIPIKETGQPVNPIENKQNEEK